MKTIIKLSLLASLSSFSVQANSDPSSKKDLVSSLIEAHKIEKDEERKAAKLAVKNARIERKRRRLKARKEIRQDINQIPQNIRNSIEERKARKKFIQEKRQEIRDYVAINTKKHGQKFILVNQISKAATEMMEKHFAGKASLVAGALCLKDMKDHKDNEEKLISIRNSCNEKLMDFKKQIKNKKIEYQDTFKDPTKREIMRTLGEIFPHNDQLHRYLAKSLRPVMTCSLRGGGLSGSWFIGLGIGAYYFKCESQLGRRVLYGSGDLTVNVGIGGVITTADVEYKKNKDGSFCETTQKLISYRTLRNSKLTLAGRTDMGLGGAINLTDSLIQKVHGGIGLGANVGFGGANFFKIKDLTTNFKDLFYLLQMGFDTHEDSTKSINDL